MSALAAQPAPSSRTPLSDAQLDLVAASAGLDTGRAWRGRYSDGVPTDSSLTTLVSGRVTFSFVDSYGEAKLTAPNAACNLRHPIAAGQVGSVGISDLSSSVRDHGAAWRVNINCQGGGSARMALPEGSSIATYPRSSTGRPDPSFSAIPTIAPDMEYSAALRMKLGTQGFAEGTPLRGEDVHEFFQREEACMVEFRNPGEVLVSQPAFNTTSVHGGNRPVSFAARDAERLLFVKGQGHNQVAVIVVTKDGAVFETALDVTRFGNGSTFEQDSLQLRQYESGGSLNAGTSDHQLPYLVRFAGGQAVGYEQKPATHQALTALLKDTIPALAEVRVCSRAQAMMPPGQVDFISGTSAIDLRAAIEALPGTPFGQHMAAHSAHVFGASCYDGSGLVCTLPNGHTVSLASGATAEDPLSLQVGVPFTDGVRGAAAALEPLVGTVLMQPAVTRMMSSLSASPPVGPEGVLMAVVSDWPTAAAAITRIAAL